MTLIAIHGAAGRMGQRLIALGQEDPQVRITAAIDAPGHASLGQDAGVLAGIGPIGVTLADQMGPRADVLIDFSVPQGHARALEQCVQTGTPMVVGTTGLDRPAQSKLEAAAKTIAILQAANMSLGVNLLLAVAGQVARQLGDDYDIEIVETHHRFKKDAPSGTALALAEAICGATGRSLDKDVVHGRQGPDAARQPRQIGMHALRSGDVVGRHTISFAGLGEELQLTHIASNRDVFARGALRAAKWLAGRKPGRYTMANVLGL